MGPNQERLLLVRGVLRVIHRLRSQKVEQSARQAKERFLRGEEPFEFWETGTGRAKFPILPPPEKR